MGKQYRNQPYLEKVGKRLVAIREQRNMSQEKLQELTGFDTRQIGRIERAESNTSISIIKAIAEALNVPIAELLNV